MLYVVSMDWLNYHHLFYFWTVAKEGGVTHASKKLLLAQPTISGQVRELERALGEKLFQRFGRSLVLTAIGQVVFRYADEIFGLGRELQDTLKGRISGRPIKLTVGIADVLPKWVSFRILEPALRLGQMIQVSCLEGKPDRLIAELAAHQLDIVLTDAPIGPTMRIKAFNHLLGESGVCFLGVEKLVRIYQEGFPASLEGAPVVLPTASSALRRSLDQWLDRQGLRPEIRVECEDSALIEAFGQAGVGLIAAPALVTNQIMAASGMKLLASVEQIKESFLAISMERKLKHPAVVAITDCARQQLFASSKLA